MPEAPPLDTTIRLSFHPFSTIYIRLRGLNSCIILEEQTVTPAFGCANCLGFHSMWVTGGPIYWFLYFSTWDKWMSLVAHVLVHNRNKIWKHRNWVKGLHRSSYSESLEGLMKIWIPAHAELSPWWSRGWWGERDEHSAL